MGAHVAHRAVVIGYGNSLRGDDAVGCRVAEEIDRRQLPDVRVISATQLVPEMVEAIARSDLVVFVDASIGTDRVVVRQPHAQSASDESHHTTPAGLLALTAEFAACPPAFVVEVPARRFDLGSELSAETHRVLPCAVDAVLALIETHA